jgi:hypothetical protein
MEIIKRLALVVLILSGAGISAGGIAHAAQSASSSYQVNEVFFGTGGELHACSTTYCSKQAAGEATAGTTTGTAYKAQGGFNTDRTPYLQFIVNSSNTDIGVLTTGSTATATGTFSVKNYLSSGYSVITASNPPQNGSYTMNALSSPAASTTGTEQFGMNLVANTSPALGANPVQVPSGTFSFGQAASGYNTPNQYKYVAGDVIASSSQSSGQTDYTISYIFNIGTSTRGGTYTFNDVLVATATF